MSSKNYQFEQLKEFDNHQMVVFFYNDSANLKGFIAIHKNGDALPSFGATRIWYYKNDLEAIKDTLKLSRLMTYKSAMAGLPYGGAKATIMLPMYGQYSKDVLITEYIKRINTFGGKFITGADVGVSESDLKLMKKQSPYIVGTRNDAVKYTALGAFYGIQSCLKELYGTESCENRSFAIQGLGKTGSSLLSLIYKDAKRIYVSDIDEKRMSSIKKEFPRVTPLLTTEIHKQKVDIFSPCALSNAININTISDLQCKAVAGIANSQLSSKNMGDLLYKLGILYAPDFVINAGGLITVVDEYEHKTNSDERIEKKVKNIKNTLTLIIQESKRRKKPTNLIAVEMAEEILKKNHG